MIDYCKIENLLSFCMIVLLSIVRNSYLNSADHPNLGRFLQS